MRRPLVTAILLCAAMLVATQSTVYAKSFVFECTNLVGSAYGFGKMGAGGWANDRLTGPIVISLDTEAPSGAPDIKIRDASGVMKSTTSLGGQIRFSNFNDVNGVIRLDVGYGPSTSETYLVEILTASNARLVFVQARGSGLIPKASILVGDCRAL